MKNRIIIILCFVFTYNLAMGAADVIEKDGVKYLAGTILVKFKDPQHASALSKSMLPKEVNQQLSAAGAGELQKVFKSRLNGKEELDKIVKINYSSPVDPYYLARKLAASESIEWAEPEFVYELAFTPNDPSFTAGSQYNLNIINAQQAWDVTTGSEDIVIAVIDTGVDWEHEDLAGNIWINEAEFNGLPGVDDDLNGFVDDIRGWDYNGTDGPPDNNPREEGDVHGTHVAGIAGAATNNSTGIASIGYNCKIMAIKVTVGIERSVDANVIFNGVLYAVDSGADIVNLSWGGGGFSNAEQEIVYYAIENGVLIVGSAGNSGVNEVEYPGRYDGVLSVGWTNSSDRVEISSNYGKEVDVMAPGSLILSTTASSHTSYGYKNGSSMAAPLVAGLAGLVKHRFPEYTPLQIAEQIRVNADNIDNMNPSYTYMMGSGRINAFKAVGNTSSKSVRVDRVQYIDEGDKDGIAESGEDFSIVVDFTNYLSPTSNLSMSISSDNNYVQMTSSVFNAGSKGTLESFNNNSGKFKFSISPDMPLNTEIDFRIEFSDAGYTDFQWIKPIIVNPVYFTQSANDIKVTVTSKGTIGFDDYPLNLEGDGFIYRDGINMLFEGGLIYGTSDSRLISAVRAGNQDFQSDEFFMITPFLISSPGKIADQEGTSIFNDDNGGSKKLNLETELTTFSFAEDEYSNFVIFRYTFQNNSGSSINNFYAGLFLDWDLYDAINHADYYDNFKFGYVYHENRNLYKPYAGVALVSGTNDGYYAIRNDGTDGGFGVYDGFTDQEKWQAISGGVSKKTAGPQDVSIVSSGGPYSIPAGQKLQVAFSLASANTLDSLALAVDRSRVKYNEIVTDIDDEASVPYSFSLAQNYPNPFNPSTTINYSIPALETGHAPSLQNNGRSLPVTLVVYDILGREVATLVNKNQSPGEYQVSFSAKGGSASGGDASSLSSGVYFYTLRAGTLVNTKKMILLR